MKLAVGSEPVEVGLCVIETAGAFYAEDFFEADSFGDLPDQPRHREEMDPATMVLLQVEGEQTKVFAKFKLFRRRVAKDRKRQIMVRGDPIGCASRSSFSRFRSTSKDDIGVVSVIGCRERDPVKPACGVVFEKTVLVSLEEEIHDVRR